MKTEDNQSDSIYGEPDTEPPAHWGWPVSVLALIIALLASMFGGCAQITAGFETAKSRSQFGVGATTTSGNWYGPFTFTWLAEPKPEQVIVESDPPFKHEITPQK